MSQGKSKTMPMQIFLGVEAVYYGIVEVENTKKNEKISVSLLRLLSDKSNTGSLITFALSEVQAEFNTY